MKRVLIVEDDAMIGALMTTMLQSMGLDVCGLETTEAGAVSAASRLRPDLMIVDATLAFGCGLAAMAEIQRHMVMPHLFTSGARLQPGVGTTPALQKPFTEQRLIAAVRRLLRSCETGAEHMQVDVPKAGVEAITPPVS